MAGCHPNRRALLRTVLGASTLSLAGCGGNDAAALRCDDSEVAVVLRSQLRGWYVSYPATTGLFDGDGQDRGDPARRLADIARAAGYSAEYYYAEDYGRGTDDKWQIELYGELKRSTVEQFVREAEMPSATDITEQPESLSRGSEVKLPWTSGLLDGRATYLSENASTVGVSVPAFGGANDRVVTLTERPDDETLQWLRSVLSGRGVMRVGLLNVPENGNPLNEFEASNYFVSEDGEAGFQSIDVTLANDGTVAVGLPVEQLLKTAYRPELDDDLRYLDRARLRIRLDGEVLSERPLSESERSYLQAYRTYISEGEGSKPSAPPLKLPSLDGRTALRVATLLRYPEDARFGLSVEHCGTE